MKSSEKYDEKEDIKYGEEESFEQIEKILNMLK